MKLLSGIICFLLSSFALADADKKIGTSAVKVKVKDSSLFTMFFISDTQYPWACINGTPIKCEDEAMAKVDAITQVSWIYKKVEEIGIENVGGIVINGDLTAYGHKSEFENFKKLWLSTLMMKGLRIFPGLGNHDYENNVDHCYNNNCATRMYHFMKDFLKESPYITNSDYKGSKVYYKFPESRLDHKGSLSYSWNVGDIHFVQLHNHPGYKNQWKSWNISKALRETFYIEPSFQWLRKDLAKAKKENKKIILSLHDTWEGIKSEEFRNILKEFKVSALFGGHLHEYVGKRKESYKGMPPHFLSGASVYQSALVVTFDKAQTMTVEAYRGKQKKANFPPPYKPSTETYVESL